MDVIVSDQPVRLVLSSTQVRPGAARISHRSARETYTYLRSRVHRPGVVNELRELVRKTGLQPLSDREDVWHVVASKVSQGELFLLQIEPQTAGGWVLPAADVSAAAPRRLTVSEAPPLPPPAKRARQDDAPAPPREHEIALLQDVQAQSLEQAAFTGTPFCEVCAQADQDKMAKAS